MARTEALTGYQHRRLELADMIRALLPVARAHHDEQREQQIRALLSRLAAGRFQLAMIGQFSRGKTTLMNALLGDAHLPMGALPMTSVVTTVRYGSRARALIRSRAAALPIEVPVTDAARFVARASADRSRAQVASVEVEIPAELLRLGFEFVDTPGVGSAIAANTAATLRYLPQADAVVFVTGFDSALTSAEAEFLRSASDHAGRLFVVINKRDLVTRAEAEDVISYVRRWARASLPAEPPVFGISALRALEGAVSGDPRQLAGSGIGPLRDALTRFLAADQGRVALGNVAALAASLIARQQRDLQAARLARDDGPGQDAVLARFEARMSELQGQLSAVAERIVSTAREALSEIIADLGAVWAAELTELVAPAIPAADEVDSGPDGDPMTGVLDALHRAGRQVTGDWLERQAAEVGESLLAAAGPVIDELLNLARSPREAGADSAGLPVFGNPAAGWTLEEIPQLSVPAVEWTVADPRAARGRHRSRGSRRDEAGRIAAAALDGAAAGFAARCQLAFGDAATDWSLRLGEQARRQAAAEAAQFRRYLSAQAHDDEFAVLADLASRLTGFQDALTSWLPDDIGSAGDRDAGPPADAVEGATCRICGQLEDTQTRYLIRQQYVLATSQSGQARYAQTGGFCGLHTWQYAHLASPVGISAGNAGLASHLAAALRAAAAGSRDTGELAGHVTAIARDRACPACAVLAGAEREAASEVAAATSEVAGPLPLCLRHLALVLESCSSLPAGQSLTVALAAALQRASENMRAYALKREALRRGLVTSDEGAAYSEALRLMAGQPALALPAPPD